MAEKFFRVYGDHPSKQRCGACGRELAFHETLKGHFMPIHADAEPVEKMEQEGQRPIWTFAGSASHFAACRDAPHKKAKN